jgi:hypothetical protein
VWDEFARALAQTPGLAHARGCILIQPVQPDLKQVRLYILAEQDGAPAALLQADYRFRDEEGGQ